MQTALNGIHETSRTTEKRRHASPINWYGMFHGRQLHQKQILLTIECKTASDPAGVALKPRPGIFEGLSGAISCAIHPTGQANNPARTPAAHATTTRRATSKQVTSKRLLLFNRRLLSVYT